MGFDTQPPVQPLRWGRYLGGPRPTSRWTNHAESITSSIKTWKINPQDINLLVLNVGNGWDWGLLGLKLIVIMDHSGKFPTFSTSKSTKACLVNDSATQIALSGAHKSISATLRPRHLKGLYVVALNVRRATTPLGFMWCCNFCAHNKKKLQRYRRSACT